MKRWTRYEEHLTSGEWHVHTSYTDGESSVDEYCSRALELGLPLIAFTEHVRRELDYDFGDLVRDIERARRSYPKLTILAGCECKVLADGSLDAAEEVLRQCDIVLMAFHSFPRDKELCLDSLREAISSPDVDIWAHPGLFLRRSGLQLEDDEVRKILGWARDERVLVEVNRRYLLPPKRWLEIGRELGVRTVRGSDAHSARSL